MSKSLEDKLERGRQYRSFDVSEKNIATRAEGDTDMIVEGYASVFDSPYLLWDGGDYKVWEKVDPRAFDDCDMSDVIMQYNHEGRVFARISNKTLEVRPDEVGLFTRAFLGGTELGRQLYEEIAGGYTTKMSFGFTIEEDERTTESHIENGIEIISVLRTITKIGKLYDVSAVSIPANDATEISARAYCEGVIAEVKEEIRAAEEAEEAERQRQDNINRIKTLAEVFTK